MDDHSIILPYLFCCKFTTNEKILDLLEDLATKKQKCPSINNNIHKYGTDYELLYNDVLKYFKTSTRIKKRCTIEERKTWSCIRKKQDREITLKKYVVKVKNQFNFDDLTTTRLYREIMTGIHFKTVNDRNISMSNSEIAEIKGLRLSLNRFDWDFDIVAAE